MNENRYLKSFFESIDGGIVSKNKKKIYFIGIIDILTHYGALKKIEHNLKNIV